MPCSQGGSEAEPPEAGCEGIAAGEEVIVLEGVGATEVGSSAILEEDEAGREDSEAEDEDDDG